LAYIVVGFILLIYVKAKKSQLNTYQLKGINSLLVIVCIQFLLGVLTILWQVPVWLGVTHQIGAFFLLTAMTFTLHRFTK
jgi:cytochrome c oxidase assembly protein subunit 15